MLWASYRAWWSNDYYLTGKPPGPGWLQWVWTLVFCVQIAMFLTLLVWLAVSGKFHLQRVMWNNLQISLAVGFSIHTLFWGLGNVLGRMGINPYQFSYPSRAVFFGGVPILGIIVGMSLLLLARGFNPIAVAAKSPMTMVSMFGISLLISVFLFFVWLSGERKRLLEATAAQAELQAQQLKRQASEAQLKALQAQIEPHFLFNTLANVVSLIDYDAPQARRMLEAFIDYLRSSLDANRRDQATVGDELAVAEHYLQLLQIRMGPRLRYSITASDAARQHALPPLTLQPLIENAVKYGLEPKLDGGAVSIKAQIEDGCLRLSVRDDGCGLDAASTARKGNGMALANIRERLKTLYGARASLTLSSPAAGGTLAMITLPATPEAA
jgi:sensor histidine kinase YesM